MAEAPGLAQRLSGGERGAGDAEHLRRHFLVGRAGALEPQDARVVVVQAGEDHERVASGAEEAVEVLEGGGRVATVDGVSEVPGRYAAGLAEERREVVLAEARPFAVCGRQQLQEAGQSPHVLAEVGGDEVGGAWIEVDRRGLQLGREPRLAGLAARRGAGIEHVPGLLHCIEEAPGDLAAAADEHQGGRGQRVGQIRDQGRHLLGGEAADGTGHDDTPSAEERRRLRGLDNGGDFVVVACQLFDGKHGVVIAHQIGHELTHGVASQDRVVAAHEVDGKLGSRHLTLPRTRRRARHTPGACP